MRYTEKAAEQIRYTTVARQSDRRTPTTVSTGATLTALTNRVRSPNTLFRVFDLELGMTRRRVSNPLALAVLGCLSERPMHPYEISTTLRTRGKENSIKLNYGSLYSVVESLQKHGLIKSEETVREGRRPERTVYSITESGTAEFEDWLAELLSTPTREFTSLEA